MTLKFWQFQEDTRRQALASLKAEGGVVVGLPTGGGKTAVSLSLAGNPTLGYTLVLVTKTSIFKWADEVVKWTAFLSKYFGSNYSPKVISIGSELSIAERSDILWDVTNRVRQGESGIIVITNYATLTHMAKTVEESVTLGGKTKKVYHWNRFFPAVFPPEYIVVDEAHKIKNPKALLTMAVDNIKAGKRILLTATPMGKKPSDAWQLFAYAQPTFRKEYPGFWKFSATFEQRAQTRYGFEYIAPRNEKALIERYSREPKLLVRYDKADILPQLPPIRVNPVRIPMEEKQAAIYNAVWKDSVVRDENGQWAWVTSDQWIRLAQIATVPSSAKNMGGRKVSLPRVSSKFDYILDVIEQATQPLVVYARFKESLNELQAYLKAKSPGTRIVRITGDENERERRDAYTAINSKSADVALLTDAGSEAIELVGADHIIFMQMPSTYLNLVQVRDRLHRPGSEQHDSILVTFLLSKGTVDESIYEVIRQGGEINHRILLATMQTRGEL
jgi:SNF2 family DNA or RNA helicase